MNPLAAVAAAASAPEAPGLSINFFWIIVAALNFIVFLALMWRFAFDPLANILAQRKTRIEQGLADAEQAHRDLAASASERDQMLVQARRDVADLIARAQKAADDLREADIAATRAELERLRVKATADIAAEHDRVLADLRSQVADLALAAAGKLVGESMTDARQRRLVEEFIRDRSEPPAGRSN
ncbi:MAG TPA: F0F1 ATP synthase subunit B [Candidatus Limnocylindrales bacterium]